MSRVLEARPEGGNDLEQVRDGEIDLSAFHAGEVPRVQLRVAGELLDREFPLLADLSERGLKASVLGSRWLGHAPNLSTRYCPLQVTYVL